MHNTLQIGTEIYARVKSQGLACMYMYTLGNRKECAKPYLISVVPSEAEVFPSRLNHGDVRTLLNGVRAGFFMSVSFISSLLRAC